jgi:hypothetical protein
MSASNLGVPPSPLSISSLYLVPYEVVSLLVMIGKRGHLTREKYRCYYGEADEIAAMITGAIHALGSS